MKKREIVILVILAAIAGGMILWFNRPVAEKKPDVLVAIQHGNQIVEEFDPSKDAVYSFEGDYGHMEVEVKDGKWRVTNEECPNHICSSMGWVDENEIIPITCMPNNVIVYVVEQ